MKRDSAAVDEYISKAPKEVRWKLRLMRAAIKEAAPGAVEGFSYRLPYYYYKGRLAWFGLSKAHIGLYLRPPVIQAHGKELAGYVTTKSAVHLPLEKEVPVDLVKMLVRARVRVNEAEESGTRRGIPKSRRLTRLP